MTETQLKEADLKGKTLAQYCDICHSVAKEKGFWEKERNVGEALMLVVTELAEAMEGYRQEDHDNFREEIADSFIRLFDFCGGMGIDIESEIARKVIINTGRPHKHGKIC